MEVDLGRHHALHGGDQLAAEPPIDVLAELHGVQAHPVHVVRERALPVVGRHDQHVVVREELVERGDHPSELRVDLLEDEPLPFRLHVVDVTGVVGCLVVDVEQVRDAALPDGLAAERRVDQVALVPHDRRGAARGLPPSWVEGLVPLRRRERLQVRVVDVQPGDGRRHPEEIGVVRRPLADAVLLVRPFVPIHADRELVAAPRRATAADHPHVPDLVADLAHPRSVTGLVAPQVGERGDQEVVRGSRAPRRRRPCGPCCRRGCCGR